MSNKGVAALEDLIFDKVEIFNTPSESVFDSNYNYEATKIKQKEAVEKWKKLSEEEKRKYNNKLNKFYEAEGISADDEKLNPSRNLYLLKNEVVARIKAEQASTELLPVNELHSEQALLELVENMENDDHIKELYRLRKKTVGSSKNAGIDTEEAARLKNCLRQGRELYLSGKNASLMVKPLNFFYSLTAYGWCPAWGQV